MKAYHRRIGMTREYLAVKDDEIWLYEVGKGWRRVTDAGLGEVHEDAVQFGGRRYMRLANPERCLPRLPST